MVYYGFLKVAEILFCNLLICERYPEIIVYIEEKNNNPLLSVERYHIYGVWKFTKTVSDFLV